MQRTWTCIGLSCLVHALAAWLLVAARQPSVKRPLPPVRVRIVQVPPTQRVAAVQRAPQGHLLATPPAAAKPAARLPAKPRAARTAAKPPAPLPAQPPQPRSPAPAAAAQSSPAANTATDAPSASGEQAQTAQTVVESSAAEAGIKAAQASYLEALRARIDDLKDYPSLAKQRRQEGQVDIQFTVHKDGAISAVSVVSPCPFAALNEAALAAVSGVGRFQPIPERYHRSEWSMVVTVVFSLMAH